ncbi:MAG: phosphopantothenoylcysteine decarboxylase [Candidatus Omnitrophica bacterium]|nr:phosphopantothenoylcysteine decarboxylase [Candidatus Omnitrophota bacterium]
MVTNLKNKKILITAGPTWVAIDKVRVISNIASGKTGFLLSEELKNIGAIVTLILGPVGEYCKPNGIKVINYCYFDELDKILSREVKSGKYDILIHMAAVSDFRPAGNFGAKISSSKKQVNLKLVQTAKLIEKIKKINRNIFLVGFKLQPQSSRLTLLSSARKLMKSSGSDLVVANTFKGKDYKAFILDSKRIYASATNKKAMAKELAATLSDLI